MVKRTGIVREFWLFMRENKAWWMAPIIFVLLGLIVLVALGSSGVAPFLYPLF